MVTTQAGEGVGITAIGVPTTTGREVEVAGVVMVTEAATTPTVASDCSGVLGNMDPAS